jgi:hypothetical protein
MFIGNTRYKFTMDSVFPPSFSTPQYNHTRSRSRVLGHGTRCLESNLLRTLRNSPPAKTACGYHSVYYARSIDGCTIQYNLIHPRGPNH